MSRDFPKIPDIDTKQWMKVASRSEPTPPTKTKGDQTPRQNSDPFGRTGFPSETAGETEGDSIYKMKHQNANSASSSTSTTSTQQLIPGAKGTAKKRKRSPRFVQRMSSSSLQLRKGSSIQLSQHIALQQNEGIFCCDFEPFDFSIFPISPIFSIFIRFRTAISDDFK